MASRIMQAAERAAAEMARWSPSKQAWARRMARTDRDVPDPHRQGPITEQAADSVTGHVARPGAGSGSGL